MEKSQMALLDKEQTNFVLSEFRYTSIDVGMHLELMDFDQDSNPAGGVQSARIASFGPNNGRVLSQYHNRGMQSQVILMNQP